jgi:ADP-ribose pyrophosphatase YjhB (NUDIX family)
VTERGVQRVAAYGVALDDRSRVLLCRLSAITSRAGAWTLPGGGIEFGEHPEAAVVRELAEETGLHGEVTSLLMVDSMASVLPEPEAVPYHAVRIVYRLAVTPGTLRYEEAGSTDQAAWFTREEIAALDVVPYALAAIDQVLDRETP